MSAALHLVRLERFVNLSRSVQPDLEVEMAEHGRLVKGVVIGSALTLVTMAAAVWIGFSLTSGSVASLSFGALSGFLLVLAALAVLGGWVAGRISPGNPFVSGALVAIVLGVSVGVGLRIFAAGGGPLWMGPALMGIAPSGALLGGLINWSGSER
ncbi:MAG: hypothetical protein R3E98_00825 [Gemmatimonadota bacterium]